MPPSQFSMHREDRSESRSSGDASGADAVAVASLQPLHQSTLVFFINLYGLICIAVASICIGLLVTVPVIDPNNQAWARKDNPVTFTNVGLILLTGVVAMLFVRGSKTTRFVLGAIGILAFFFLTLCQLGAFSV